jgi:hypothetical protein
MRRYDAHLRLPSGQVHPEIHVNKEEVKTFGLNLLFPIRTRKLCMRLFRPISNFTMRDGYGNPWFSPR